MQCKKNKKQQNKKGIRIGFSKLCCNKSTGTTLESTIKNPNNEDVLQVL